MAGRLDGMQAEEGKREGPHWRSHPPRHPGTPQLCPARFCVPLHVLQAIKLGTRLFDTLMPCFASMHSYQIASIDSKLLLQLPPLLETGYSLLFLRLLLRRWLAACLWRLLLVPRTWGPRRRHRHCCCCT